MRSASPPPRPGQAYNQVYNHDASLRKARATERWHMRCERRGEPAAVATRFGDDVIRFAARAAAGRRPGQRRGRRDARHI